ncbi:hypothetical protein NDU88_010160 [Pleurodeles waltl]|uniref:Uncharacterized protein n=1 Tax=Pleurodeles waltl TaxID=8319 RepID=A0AAV7RZV8_PLEWA|nr:hypothetical protein NDU88_010160 [Pleurodeles waltl]
MKRRGRRCFASVKKAIDVPGSAEAERLVSCLESLRPSFLPGKNAEGEPHLRPRGAVTRERSALKHEAFCC